MSIMVTALNGSKSNGIMSTPWRGRDPRIQAAIPLLSSNRMPRPIAIPFRYIHSIQQSAMQSILDCSGGRVVVVSQATLCYEDQKLPSGDLKRSYSFRPVKWGSRTDDFVVLWRVWADEGLVLDLNCASETIFKRIEQRHGCELLELFVHMRRGDRVEVAAVVNGRAVRYELTVNHDREPKLNLRTYYQLTPTYKLTPIGIPGGALQPGLPEAEAEDQDEFDPDLEEERLSAMNQNQQVAY